MRFNSFDSEDDGACNGDNFVDISNIFAMQDAFLFGTEPPDGVYTEYGGRLKISIPSILVSC